VELTIPLAVDLDFLSLGQIYRRFVLAEPTERPLLSRNVVRPSLPVVDPVDLPDESLN